MKIVKYRLPKLLLILCIVFYAKQFGVALQDHQQQDLNCLAANVFFESRGDTLLGQRAVAEVTLNRSISKTYGGSICKVVFAKGQFSWTKQRKWKEIQSLLNGSIPFKNPQTIAEYQQAGKVAVIALKTPCRVLPDTAMWFHAESARPDWVQGLKLEGKIGSHYFYSK